MILLSFPLAIPTVSLYPKQLTLVYDNEASFVCQYSSSIPSGVLWYKDGQLLSSDADGIVINNTQHDTSVLKIISTSASDSGTYSCSVNNSIGTGNDNAILSVGK